MATRFRLNFEQIFGTSAQVLAGGTLTFAISGGAPDQLQAIYSDDALTVTKLNPVTLDSAGKHGDIFLQAKDYRVIVKDAAGIQIPGGDVDPVHGAVGSADVMFIQAGTGAVPRPVQERMRDLVSVKDFGAKGDGSTDDTAAFQAAINYCIGGLKTLLLPGTPGSFYKVTAPLVIAAPMSMQGADKFQVTIGGFGLSAGQYVLDIDGTAYGTFQDIAIGGFTVMGDHTPQLLRIKNVSGSRFFDIGLRDGTNGVVYTGTRCFSNVFERIGTVTGVTESCFSMAAHTGGGQHSFRECSFGGKNGFVIGTDTVTDGIAFFNCNFEGCTVNSFYCGGTVRGLSFFGCRTEGCNGNDFQIAPAVGKLVCGLVIEGCNFDASDNGSVARIILGGASGLVRGFNIVANSVGHGASNYGAALVVLNGDGESGVVANNYLNGLKANCSAVIGTKPNVSVYNNEANDGKFTGTLSIV